MATDVHERDRARPRRARRRRMSPLTLVGVLLLVAGLGCLGWVGYQYLGTDVVSQRAFDQETQGLHERWAANVVPGQDTTGGSRQPKGGPRAKAAQVPGTAIALLRIPRLGADYQVPVVAGTELDDLSRGVGHYDGTAGPGQIGNFALAGHRITHGQPFARLLSLEKGDQVVVETQTAIYTYVMDTAPRDLTVKETAGWVLDAVPNHPEQTPTQAVITLTTCQDLFHSPDRSVGFGHLESTQDK